MLHSPPSALLKSKFTLTVYLFRLKCVNYPSFIAPRLNSNVSFLSQDISAHESNILGSFCDMNVRV